MKKPSSTITGTVLINFDGKPYDGTYLVQNQWITVSTPYGSKSAAVSEVPPGHLDINTIARLLMFEIMAGAKRDH